MSSPENTNLKDIQVLIAEAINNGSNFSLDVTGNSMWPFIKDGDKVNISPVNSINTGDIIVIFPDNIHEIIIHRIIRQKGDKFEVKGDNNKSSDGWFNKHDFNGKIKKVMRNKRSKKLGITYGKYAVVLISRYLPFSRLLNPLYQITVIFRRFSPKN